jgi:cytoskeletal protein RodZ
MTAGSTLREARAARGLDLAEAAEELGVATHELRALEWDRPDLVAPHRVDALLCQYCVFLGLEAPAPDVEPADVPAAWPVAETGLRSLARFRLVAHAIPLAAVLAVAAFALTAWTTGWHRNGGGNGGTNRPASPPSPTRTTTVPAPTMTSAAPAMTSKETTSSAKATQRGPAKIAVTATRGDTWLAARDGSAGGRSLFEGVLSAGETQTYRARRVWLRLGAASNVDLAVNGKPVGSRLSGTVDVVVSRAGVRPA